MRTLADLVATGRKRDDTVAIDAVGRTAPYTYRTLCTNAWKAGNLLGHYTYPGGSVAVVVGPKAGPASAENTTTAPEGRHHTDSLHPLAASEGRVDAADPLLAVIGGALVGAMVTLSPESPVAADVLVRPAGAEWAERYPATPGCSVLVYGGESAEPSVEQFEAALWSENPIAPPERVDAATPALRTGDGTHTHGDLLEAAATVVDRHGLGEGSRVVLAGDLRELSVLVAGAIAPLSAGATIQLGESADSAGDSGSTDGTDPSREKPTLVVD